MRKALPSSYHIASPPIVRSVTSLELRGKGELGIALELHPADIPAARARIQTLMHDLVDSSISADEVELARLAGGATYASEESTNDSWAARLSLVLRDQRVEKAMVDARHGSTVFGHDVAEFFKRYLAGHSPIVIAAKAKIDEATLKRNHL